MFPSFLLAPARRSCHGSSGAPSSSAWRLPKSRFAPGFASSLTFNLGEVLFAVSRVKWDHEPRGLLQPKSQWSWKLLLGFWDVGEWGAQALPEGASHSFPGICSVPQLPRAAQRPIPIAHDQLEFLTGSSFPHVQF